MPMQASLTDQTQLIPLSLVSPAFKGLNLEGSGGILGPEWATTLDNMVFDSTGKPASRKGWTTLTSTPGAGVIMRIFEYFKADGTSSIISSTDANIYENTGTLTSRVGTLTITEGNIKFDNFNDSVVAFGVGTGGIPAIKTGTGNFADITVNAGTAPTGRIGTSAFGRLWCVDTDGKTVRYSALLDETRWDTANGGGSIDFSKVWPEGQDEVVAIQELGADLIVFGRNNTIILTDGSGSTIGLDPTAMYVSDTIPGLGAVSQFAICRTVGDLWVLTYSGVVSLQREIVQRSTPVGNISRHVQSSVITLTQAETDVDDITMAYNPKESLVVLCFPGSNSQVTFDTRFPLDDGAHRATTWTSDLQTLTYIRSTQTFNGSLTGVVGEIMNYAGYDDDGTSYAVDYESGWLDLGQELNSYLKFMKRMTSFIYVSQNVVVTHKMQYDFGVTERTIQRTAAGAAAAEWGLAEWGANGVYDYTDGTLVAGTDVAQWSGAITLRTMDAPGLGSGQYIRVGLRLDTSSGEFSLQQINLFAKVGRIAT